MGKERPAQAGFFVAAILLKFSIYKRKIAAGRTKERTKDGLA